MPDNKRYVGDVFIDGKTDKLLQEFLTNLFEQYNGEGKGFNADMLDGHHYSEIEEELNRLDAEKLSTITIGSTIFNSNQSTNYLHFSDILYDDYTALPWKDTIPLNYDINQTLMDLYTFVMTEITNSANTKVDKEQVNPNDTSESPRMKVLSDNNFSDTDKNNLNKITNGILPSITQYTDENNNTQLVLNSQLTNGLCFILITQEIYNSYKNSSDPNKQKFINSWRNVFIFVDEMPDSADYQNPISYDLKDGYRFRLANDPASIEDVEINVDYDDPNPVWLQFKHNWASEWTNIAPLQDFLLGAEFDDTVVDIVENNQNINYNQIALKRALESVLNNKQNANYLGLNYIPIENKTSLIHQLIKSGSPLAQSIDSNGFANVDITNAFQPEFTEVNNKLNAITNQQKTGSLDIQITNLKDTVDGLNNQINGAQANSIIKKLSSIEQNISNINATVSSINSNLNAYGTWETVNVGGLTYTSNGKTYYSNCTFNRKLQIAVFYFSFNQYGYKGQSGWVTHSTKDTATARTVKAKPTSNVVFPTVTNPNTFVRLDTNGDVHINSYHSKDGYLHILGHGLYRIGGYN